MRKLLFSLCLMFIVVAVHAQAVNGIIDTYYLNGTAVNGIKIKTNLPFSDGSQMPTIIMEGYSYASPVPSPTAPASIGLILNYYIFGGAFINATIASFGSYTPPVILANEGGKVVIFINSKDYFLRMSIRAYAEGRSADVLASYQSWDPVDEALTGTAQLQVPYKNRFAGDVFMPGGIWNKDGNVGIGTANPQTKLAVAGDISAKRVKVTQTGWPDYVFQPEYKLPPLYEVECYIKAHQHLPEIPTAAEVEKEGLDLGEINKKLLQKVEELTLYQIQQQKEHEAVLLRLKVLEAEMTQMKAAKK